MLRTSIIFKDDLLWNSDRLDLDFWKSFHFYWTPVNRIFNRFLALPLDFHCVFIVTNYCLFFYSTIFLKRTTSVQKIKRLCEISKNNHLIESWGGLNFIKNLFIYLCCHSKSRHGSRSTAQQYGVENVLFYKRKRCMYLKNSIGNFSVLLELRVERI